MVVEDEYGLHLGQVVDGPREASHEELEEAEGKVKRKATQEDIDLDSKNREREREVCELAQRRADKLGLPLKVADVEFTLDGKRLIVYFTSEEKVDIRKLGRDLARIVKLRVELERIGVRDEAKLVGGLGPCGRPLCCATFLKTFKSVTIRMAKEQGLQLNPDKISGVCGKLMCCLAYEFDFYHEERPKFPKEGELVRTPAGEGRAVEVSVIRGMVKVEVPGEGVMWFKVEEIERTGLKAPPPG
ncbi:MAG TPA: stage 0 sporulation protein [Armatimonadetes bacterium]|nr:stage 0 sporulation protein [Armatimonadota bacterium]